jgi:hypothetical protein
MEPRMNSSTLQSGLPSFVGGSGSALRTDGVSLEARNGLSMDRDMRVQVATLGAKAAFTLQAWDHMEVS